MPRGIIRFTIEAALPSFDPQTSRDERGPVANLLLVVVLAAVYWVGSWLVAAFSSGYGAQWGSSLQHALDWPSFSASILASVFGAIGLAIIALPVAGILVRLFSRMTVVCALLIALPATASILFDLYVALRVGAHFPPAVFALIGFDIGKTLLIPVVLTALARCWMPAHLLQR